MTLYYVRIDPNGVYVQEARRRGITDAERRRVSEGNQIALGGAWELISAINEDDARQRGMRLWRERFQ